MCRYRRKRRVSPVNKRRAKLNENFIVITQLLCKSNSFFNKQPFMSSTAQKRNFSSPLCGLSPSPGFLFLGDEKCCDSRTEHFGTIYFDSSNNATQEGKNWMASNEGRRKINDFVFGRTICSKQQSWKLNNEYWLSTSVLLSWRSIVERRQILKRRKKVLFSEENWEQFFFSKIVNICFSCGVNKGSFVVNFWR